MAKHWLPTTPGIVSRTADGAYGKYLKTRTPAGWLPTTRSVPTPAGAQGGMPPSPELRDKTRKPGFAPYEGYGWQWNDTVNQWQQIKIGGAIPLGNGVTVPQGGVGPTSAPGTEYPLLSKRHIPGFFKGGSLQDWLGQDWLARMQQLLSNLPAPLKNWLTNAPAQLNQALSQLPAPLKNCLSNYPRLPQSPIPTPKVEYPAPGRPHGPSKPGYQNPFAWRRKNNSWW